MKKKLLVCLFSVCLLLILGPAISASGDLPPELKVIATFPGTEPAFSPDGKHLAIIEDGAVKIWDVRRKSLIKTIDTKYKEATLAVYSPDGRMMAIASPQKNGRDAYSGFEIWQMHPVRRVAAVATDGPVIAMDFNPADSRQLCIGFESSGWIRKIWLFDIPQKKTLHEFSVKYDLNQLCFSPDGKLLVAAPGKIWNLDTLEPHFSSFPQDIYSAAFSRDGKRLFLDCRSGFKVIDMTTGTVIEDIRGRPGSSHPLVLLQNDQIAVRMKCFYNSQIGFWDVGSDSLIGHFEVPGNVRCGSSFSLAVSPDERFLAENSSESSTTRVWDIKSLDALVKGHRHEAGLPSLVFGRKYGLFVPAAFNRNGSLAVAVEGDELVFLDTFSGRQLARYPNTVANHLLNGLMFVNQDKWLVQVGDRVVVIRNADTAEILQRIELPVTPSHFAMTADGARMAIHHGQRITIYDTAGAAKVVEIDDPLNDHILSLSFCAGNMLAVHRAWGSKDNLRNHVAVYDADGNQHAYWGSSDTIFSMTSDPDGQRLGFVTLAAKKKPGRAWVWSPDRAASPTLVFSVKYIMANVQAMSFTGDPAMVAVFNGKELKLVDLISGNCVLSLPLFKDFKRYSTDARWMDRFQARWNAEHKTLFYHGQSRKLRRSDYSGDGDQQAQYYTWKGVEPTSPRYISRTLYVPGQITHMTWQGTKLLATYTWGSYCGYTLWQAGSSEVFHSLEQNGFLYRAAYDDASGRLAASAYSLGRPQIDISGLAPHAKPATLQFKHTLDSFRWVPGSGKFFEDLDEETDKIFDNDYIGWLPGGKRLISANDNGLVWLWDIDERKKTLQGELNKTIDPGIGPIKRLAVSPKGRYLATAGASEIALISLPEGQQVRRYHTEGKIFHIQWTADGKRLYSIEEHGEHRYLKTIPVENGTGTVDSFLLPESRFAWPYAVSPDGRYVAGQDEEEQERVSVLDRHTGKLFSIEVGEHYLPGILFDPLTNALVIANGHEIIFWDFSGSAAKPR
jgi:WD40 repeat protein